MLPRQQTSPCEADGSTPGNDEMADDDEITDDEYADADDDVDEEDDADRDGSDGRGKAGARQPTEAVGAAMGMAAIPKAWQSGINAGDRINKCLNHLSG